MTDQMGHDPLADDVKKDNMTDEQLELLALQNLMSSRHGRSFMWSFLNQCGIFNSDFNDNPTRMAYLTGRRDSARVMDTELKSASMRYYLMMIEENGDDNSK